MNDDEMQETADAIAEMFPPRSWWWKLCRRFCFFWQRRTRGWDDSETWSLDYTIAKFVLPRLRRFRALNNGHPGDLSWEEWLTNLDKMIWAFELIDGREWEPGEAARNDKDVQEGLELFGKWFRHLWW